MRSPIDGRSENLNNSFLDTKSVGGLSHRSFKSDGNVAHHRLYQDASIKRIKQQKYELEKLKQEYNQCTF